MKALLKARNKAIRDGESFCCIFVDDVHLRFGPTLAGNYRVYWIKDDDRLFAMDTDTGIVAHT